MSPQADPAAESAARAAAVTAPNTFQGVQPTASGEDADDAALDALFGQHGMPDDSAHQQAPDAYRQLDAAPTQEHRSEETPPAPATAEGKTTPPAPAASDPGTIAAKRALMRDGWSLDDLNRLAPELLIQMGDLRSGRQDAVDKLLDDRSRNLDPSAKAKSETGQTEGETPPDQSELTSDGRRARAQAVLAEYFGDDDEGARVLAALQDLQGGAEAGRAPAQQSNGAMAEVLLERQARARLADVYPQLKSDSGLGRESAVQSDATWDSITADAALFYDRQVALTPGITPSQRVSLIEQCHDQAAGLHLGTPLSDAQRAERQSISAAKGNGSISTPVGKVDPSETFSTTDDFDAAWFDAKYDGDKGRMKALEKLLPSLNFQ